MEDHLKTFNENTPGKTMQFFNLKYIEIKNEEIIFSCQFTETSTNPRGFVQGGMITAVLDDATSASMISGYERKKAPLTTDLHMLFHRPLEIGTASIKVKIIKLGNRSATSEGRLYNHQDKLVATLLHTAQPVDIPN